MDTNNDGSITRDDWNSAFAKHDSNNDGKLTREEMMAGHGQMTQDRFKGLDVNADGRVSRDEWRGDKTGFSKMDKNSDGWLSSDEWNDPAAAAHRQNDPAAHHQMEKGQNKSQGKDQRKP
jgi:Ca2+-binding EF-hand superfamily protein